MALSILNPTGLRLEVNHLMIQPTRWCALNCKGCYVKAHEDGEQSFHTPWQEQVKLFQKFYDGEEAWANQITISIDDYPPDLGMTEPNARVLFGMAYSRQTMRMHMVQLHNQILYHMNTDKRPFNESPCVQFTFNSDKTLQSYVMHHDFDPEIIAVHLDVMSFSHIYDLDYIKSFSKHTHVNYNHLIPRNVTSFNIDKHVEKMVEIGRVVDSVYLVLNKLPIGRPMDQRVQDLYKRQVQSDLSYIRTITKCVPEDVRRKINIDSCIKDVDKFRKTGFGCSANVSKFQVWPDGSVSGCPYAFSGNTKRSDTAEGIIQNIREARRHNDFKGRCYLPRTFDSVSRRS